MNGGNVGKFPINRKLQERTNALSVVYKSAIFSVCPD
jgi:hypothetical protein